MSPSLSPLRRAPYLAGSDTLETSSGSPGASVSGASISAQEDREEQSLGVVNAKFWKAAGGWGVGGRGGGGEGPPGGWQGDWSWIKGWPPGIWIIRSRRRGPVLVTSGSDVFGEL